MLPARMVEALNKRQLQTLSSNLVLRGSANEQFMTAQSANFLDLHFSHGKCKLWDRQSEGRRGVDQTEPDSSRKSVFLVILPQRISD